MAAELGMEEDENVCLAGLDDPSMQSDDDDAASRRTGSTVAMLNPGGKIPESKGGTPATKSSKSKESKDEKKKCKLCKKWFVLADFPLNSSMCRGDKQTVDNLYRQANAQGQGEWFAEVRSDPERLEALVRKYEEKCPRQTLKTKRGTFNIVTFIEEFEASSQVKNTADGKMMWWGEYLHFARKPKGGASTLAFELRGV